jgi:xylulose-5-phosphate/fructose-6-phosphate phosphoketolase
VPKLGARAAYVKQSMRDKRIEHRQNITEYGYDLPEVHNWQWSSRGKSDGSAP